MRIAYASFFSTYSVFTIELVSHCRLKSKAPSKVRSAKISFWYILEMLNRED